MPQTSNQQQGESTTYHGDAHGDKPSLADRWLQVTVEAAVRCHTLAMLSGGTPRLPVAEWLQARRAADEALTTLLEAVQLSAGRLGAHVDERGSDAAPTAGGFSTRRLKADDTLLDLGYRWSASLQQWLQPVPAPTAAEIPQAIAAASELSRMGYAWTGAKWENRRPTPSVLDQPLGVPVLVGRGSTSAMRFGPETPVRSLVEHAEAMHNKLARAGAL